MTNIKTVSIKGKPYITVAERVRLVHEERETFEMVESKPIQVGDQWIWQVVILVEGKRFIGTAEVFLNAAKNTADGTNPWACAETSALGRSIGFAGLGSLESISSADEMTRALAAQDAIAERPQVRKPSAGSEAMGSITDAQKAAITRLMKEVPANLAEWSQQKASEMIRDLQSRQKAS